MQMTARLSFEWHRALAGYDIVPPVKRWEGWGKPGHQTVPKVSPLAEVWSHRVKPSKGGFQTYQPLKDAGLYRRFAKLDFEPASYREFANKFGLLTAGDSTTLWTFASFHACVRLALGQKVPRWVLEQITQCRRELSAQVRARPAQDVRIDLVLHGLVATTGPGITGLSRLIEDGCTPRVVTVGAHTALVVRPRNMMVAIALQSIRHLSGEDERMGTQLLDCRRCGEVFEVGPGTRRRSTSKFCTRQCENAFRYANRKVAGSTS